MRCCGGPVRGAFPQAWDAARVPAVAHLSEVAWGRALHGALVSGEG